MVGKYGYSKLLLQSGCHGQVVHGLCRYVVMKQYHLGCTVASKEF